MPRVLSSLGVGTLTTPPPLPTSTMTSSLLFKDVRIFDGETEIPNGSVLVENGKIVRVSPESLDCPNDSTVVISKPGHTLIPGLIDGHIHAHFGIVEALTQSLKFGVTTVCDMTSDPDYHPKLRELAANDANCADFRTASRGAVIPDGWPIPAVQLIASPEESRAMIASWPQLQNEKDVDEWIEDRVKDADYIKTFHEDGNGLVVKPVVPSLELQTYIVKVAHDRNLLVVAHAFSLQGAIDILHCGIDGTAHTIIDKPPTQELIDAYKLNNAHCNPTLACCASFTKEGKEDAEKFIKDPRVARFLTAEHKGTMCKCMSLANDEARVEYAYESVRMMKAAGIDIIVGTDATGATAGLAFGASVHHEMALLVSRCGFTPTEALTSATSLVSKRLRLAKRGRIAEGFRADLVLVEGNPMQNIDDSLNLRGVWKQGVLSSSHVID